MGSPKQYITGMPMLTIIDGVQYRKMVLAGANRVITKQEELNKINVFPVPDGDTGSNMAYTFSNVASAISAEQEPTPNVSILSRDIADASINGALGNSGSIIAQFFQGLNEKFHNSATVSLELFSDACAFAARSAREAIEEPVEGTIITVMHDWAFWLETNHEKYEDFHEFFADSLVSAEKSLAETPQKLKILLKNNVVDAGAKGFVHYLQGINDFFLLGHIDNVKPDYIDAASHTEAVHVASDEEVHLASHLNDVSSAENLINQYCTECIIHGKRINIKDIRAEMSRWGNSLVVVGNNHKTKIHIHTNAPEKVFRKANEFGDVLETKADDMWAQYRASINWQNDKRIAILTDSSCALPQEFFVKYNIIIMPLQVLIDGQPYLDSVNITRQEFLKQLISNKKQISTSQAPMPDMKAAFEKGLRQSDAIIMVALSSGISGTYNSLKRLSERYEEENVTIIDSKNAAAGHGLIVKAVAHAAHAGKSIEEVTQIAEKTASNTYQFISLLTMKYAVKGGRMKRSTGFLLSLFCIKPVMHFNKAGKIVKIAITFGRILSRRKIFNLVSEKASKMQQPEFCISHIQADKDATKLAKKLQTKFDLDELPPLVEITPVVTTHVGPGTISVAVTDSTIEKG